MDDTSIKIGSFWVGKYIYIVYQQTVWLTVGINRETEASSPVKLLDRTPLTAASSPSQSHQFWDLNLQSGFIRSNKKQHFFERLNIMVFEPTKHGITWGFRALPCEKTGLIAIEDSAAPLPRYKTGFAASIHWRLWHMWHMWHMEGHTSGRIGEWVKVGFDCGVTGGKDRAVPWFFQATNDIRI